MRTWVQSQVSLSGLRICRCQELWCSLQMRLGSQVAVVVVQAEGCSSDWTPSLGTSICRRCGDKKTKKKKKKRRKNQREEEIYRLSGIPSARGERTILYWMIKEGFSEETTFEQIFERKKGSEQ